jgi:hypothetical protein
MRDYVPASAVEERAERAAVVGRTISNTTYRSIKIVEPAGNATIRANDGRLTVKVDLDPTLRQTDYVAVNVGGKMFRSRFGDSLVELTDLERGTQQLQAQIIDSKGKVLITSDVISFTVQRTQTRVSVNPVTGDDYVDLKEAGSSVTVSGSYTGADKKDAEVSLRFPASGWVSAPTAVNEDGTWSISVPGELLAREASFNATASVNNMEFQTTSTHSIDRKAFQRYQAPASADYKPTPSAGFDSQGGSILTTPGRTNPAFAPNFKP